MELLEQYQKQYIEFCNIDDFNLEQRAKKVPAEKHFWVSRLIEAKIKKGQLLKQKKQLKFEVTKKLIGDAPVSLNKKTLDQIEDTPQLEQINDSLQEMDYLIEYLEHLVKAISFIAQDIKNIISIKTLETT